MSNDQENEHKSRAAAWFRTLRGRIVASFEDLEDRYGQGAPGRFEVTPTSRADGGGGLMSVMRGGRVFEKIGVNVSEVHGTLGEKGAAGDGRARGSRHGQRPALLGQRHRPCRPYGQPAMPCGAYEHTRMFWTPHAWWFGGGADLNPCLEYAEDTAHFHAGMQAACDAHDPGYYSRFKAWADEYFPARLRGRARGVGGIFYDDLNTGNWEADFAFTQSVGAAFLPAFVPLIEKRVGQPWTEADRDADWCIAGYMPNTTLSMIAARNSALKAGMMPMRS